MAIHGVACIVDSITDNSEAGKHFSQVKNDYDHLNNKNTGYTSDPLAANIAMGYASKHTLSAQSNLNAPQ